MISITIEGEPHPQRRPRAYRMGRGVRIHEHQSDIDYKKDAAKQIIAQLPTDVSRPVFRSGVALNVRLSFHFSCPKADRRKRNPRGWRWHTKKKDLDNLAKATLDAANGILWADDGQIVALHLYKVIAGQDDPPKTTITVKEQNLTDRQKQGG